MAIAGPSPERLQAIVDAIAVHGPTKAAVLLKMPKRTLEERAGAAKRQGITAGAIDETPEYQRTLQGLRDRAAGLEGQLRAIHRDNLTTEEVRTKIFGLAGQPPSVPKWVVHAAKSKGVAGVPCTIWSDWHWGEVVDPTQVNGVNAYNLAIARKRAKTLVERTIDLCMNHMTGAEYPGIVVCLGGDMISGDIHEELAETNEMPSMPTLIDLVGVLQWALPALADRFGRVFVPVVAGNHGRNTHKPRFKNYAHTNFDWLVGTFLAKLLAHDKRIVFQISEGSDVAFSVFGTRHLLTHGNNLGTAGGDGIIGSLGPILRGDFKVRNASGSMGMPYDTIVMGHWHQYLPLRRIIVNGCLKGYDEYARLKLRAPPEPPQQAVWWVHPKHGITFQAPVFVDESKPAATSEWVSWAREAA